MKKFIIREEEENNLPKMTKLFFLYVLLNSTHIAELRKEKLVKHIGKRAIQTGRLFFSSSLIGCAIILSAFAIQETPRFPWVQDGQLCYIEPNGKIISTDKNTLQYPDIQKIKTKLKAYKHLGMSGFKNTDGRVVIKPGYEAVGEFVGDYAWVKIDHKRYYYIDQNEQILIHYSFDRCYDFQDGMARVRDENSAKGYYGFGYLDTQGTVHIPLIYRDATDFVNGYALVMDDSGAWFLIDKDGREVQGPNYDLKRIEGDIFGH